MSTIQEQINVIEGLITEYKFEHTSNLDLTDSEAEIASKKAEQLCDILESLREIEKLRDDINYYESTNKQLQSEINDFLVNEQDLGEVISYQSAKLANAKNFNLSINESGMRILTIGLVVLTIITLITYHLIK